MSCLRNIFTPYVIPAEAGLRPIENPDAVLAKAETINELDFRSPIAVEDKFHGKPWMPRSSRSMTIGEKCKEPLGTAPGFNDLRVQALPGTQPRVFLSLSLHQ